MGVPLVTMAIPPPRRKMGDESVEQLAVPHPVQGLADGHRPRPGSRRAARPSPGYRCRRRAPRSRSSRPVRRRHHGRAPACPARDPLRPRHRTRRAIGKVSCPVPRPRSTTTSSPVRPKTPASLSITGDGIATSVVVGATGISPPNRGLRSLVQCATVRTVCKLGSAVSSVVGSRRAAPTRRPKARASGWPAAQ